MKVLDLVWSLVMPIKKVLIVDDHPVIRVAVRILLQQEKYVIVGQGGIALC